MTRRSLILSLALAAMTLGCNSPAPRPAATPSSQQPAPQPSEAAAPVSAATSQAFGRYDLNKDSQLDLTEFVDGKYGDMRFIKAPTDSEIAGHKATFTREFEQLDTNKDQRLSLAEFAKSVS